MPREVFARPRATPHQRDRPLRQILKLRERHHLLGNPEPFGGRFPYDGIAVDQRGPNFAESNRERIIPRSDQCDHAAGAPPAIARSCRARAVRSRKVDARSEESTRRRHLPAPDRHRFADLVSKAFCQQVPGGRHCIGQPLQHGNALLERCRSEIGLRVTRAPHRAVDLRRTIVNDRP